jgi:drug/metabolite transporter (DMT)-like permease
MSRSALALTALVGVVGVAMPLWLHFLALSRLPVGVALLVEFTAPVFVALWMRFARRESMRRRVWLAVTLVIGGLGLVAQVWSGFTLDGLGLLAAIADAVTLAAYFILCEGHVRRCSPLAVAALSFVGSSVFLSLLLPWWTFPFHRLASPVEIGSAVVPAGLLVVWVVLLGTVAPFVLELHGLRHIGPTRTGLVATVEPVLGGLVAWSILDERLAAVQVAGALVVLAGIVLAETAGSPERTRSAKHVTRQLVRPRSPAEVVVNLDDVDVLIPGRTP